MIRLKRFATLLSMSLLLISVPVAAGQSTSFTYQGRLNDGGTPANGSYVLRFTALDGPNGNQVGNQAIINPATVSNGLFTVDLDFGPGLAPKGGTIYLTAADEHGMMVSFIQSNYMGFGSGVVVPGYGVSLQNRGHGFSLEEKSANVVAPGKRPFHTIIPAFITKDGKPVATFVLMGGAMQPQGHMQVFSRTVDYGQNPQAAIDGPRPAIQLRLGRALLGAGRPGEAGGHGEEDHRAAVARRQHRGELGAGHRARVDHEVEGRPGAAQPLHGAHGVGGVYLDRVVHRADAAQVVEGGAGRDHLDALRPRRGRWRREVLEQARELELAEEGSRPLRVAGLERTAVKRCVPLDDVVHDARGTP